MLRYSLPEYLTFLSSYVLNGFRLLCKWYQNAQFHDLVLTLALERPRNPLQEGNGSYSNLFSGAKTRFAPAFLYPAYPKRAQKPLLTESMASHRPRITDPVLYLLRAKRL